MIPSTGVNLSPLLTVPIFYYSVGEVPSVKAYKKKPKKHDFFFFGRHI